MAGSVIRTDLEHRLVDAVRRRDKHRRRCEWHQVEAWRRQVDRLLDQWLAAELPTRPPSQT